MENFFYFIIGALIAYLILQRPLKISIHHTYETLTPALDIDKLEDDMLKPDVKRDKMYEDEQNIDDILKEVNDVMGGSDR